MWGIEQSISQTWLNFKNKDDKEAYNEMFSDERRLRARLASIFYLLYCVTQCPFIWSEATPPYSLLATLLFFFALLLPSAILFLGTVCFRKCQRNFQVIQVISFVMVVTSLLRAILVVAMCNRNLRVGTYLECPGVLLCFYFQMQLMLYIYLTFSFSAPCGIEESY